MRRTKRLTRRLFGPRRRLPLRIRLGFEVGGFVLLWAAYALTHSDGLQLLVALALLLGALPALGRRFGHVDALSDAVGTRNPPLRVWAPSLALFVAWFAAVWPIPGSWVGSWGWLWLAVAPGLEACTTLALRDVERNGIEAWKPGRPRRDALTAGLVTGPGIVAILLVAGEPSGPALLVGAFAGLYVMTLGLVMSKLVQAARRPPDLNQAGGAAS